MVDLNRGLKAGAVSGVIYGVAGPIINGLIYSFSWRYGSPFYLFLNAIWGIIPGLILGIIIGLIFAATYKLIPGTTSMVKGIIISIFFWLIFSLLLQYIFSYGSFYLSESRQIIIMLDLILYVFFGILLGVFWDKFEKLERKCLKCQRVIPKDALLCPYCGETLEQEKSTSIKNQNETEGMV